MDSSVHAAAERGLSPTAAISNQMVRLLSKYVGRGPTRARTTLSGNVVLVTMADTMTRAERNLVAAGEGEAVRAMRQTLQRSMREEAVAAVETILSQPVIAYMADIDTEANITIAAFVLRPLASPANLESVVDDD